VARFFKLPKGDLLYIAVLLVFAVISFLPWSREVTWGGMAALGWLMAALMVLSPVIALVRLRRRRNHPGARP
jgi:formate hydrogenlyase subunit 4